MAFYYPVLALLLSTGTCVLSKALPKEPFHAIHDFAEMERQKRQSHPAATVARYQERPSGILQREGFRDDHLVDYLTPPRPPDPLDSFGKGFNTGLSTPSPPVLPGTIQQQSLDGTWNLGYDADDVLIPPIDPYLFGPETKYNTIQQTKSPLTSSFGSSKSSSENSQLKSSFENFNFDKDPFFNDASVSSRSKPSTNSFQDPVNENDNDSKFRPFIPSPSFPLSNLGNQDQLTNGHSGDPNGQLPTGNNLNSPDPNFNSQSNNIFGFSNTNHQANGIRSQNFNFDTLSHSLLNPNTGSTATQNNFNTQNHNVDPLSQSFTPLIFNNNKNDPLSQSFQTVNSNSDILNNNYRGSQNSKTDLFSNNFRGSQDSKIDLSIPFVKRHTAQNKRQIDSEEDNESINDEANDGEEDHHHKSAGPVYTFVKTDKHGHFKWGVRHMVS